MTEENHVNLIYQLQVAKEGLIKLEITSNLDPDPEHRPEPKLEPKPEPKFADEAKNNYGKRATSYATYYVLSVLFDADIVSYEIDIKKIDTH